MELGFIAIIIGVVWSGLSIALFFKVWGMCNDVDQIAKQIGMNKIEIDELIYLAKINDPTFNTKLQKSIYDNFYKVYKYRDEVDVDSEIKKLRARWEKRCEYYNWEFPEVFANVKTYNDFKEFIFLYAPDEVQ